MPGKHKKAMPKHMSIQSRVGGGMNHPQRNEPSDPGSKKISAATSSKMGEDNLNTFDAPQRPMKSKMNGQASMSQGRRAESQRTRGSTGQYMAEPAQGEQIP